MISAMRRWWAVSIATIGIISAVTGTSIQKSILVFPEDTTSDHSVNGSNGSIELPFCRWGAVPVGASRRGEYRPSESLEKGFAHMVVVLARELTDVDRDSAVYRQG